MEELTSFLSDFVSLSNNRVIVNANQSECKDNSKISFLGENNILYIEDGVRLSHSSIKFFCNNSLVYLRKSKHVYQVIIDVYNDSTVYIGKDCFFNKQLHMIASEQQNIVIGDECLFSFGVFIRTADAHLIYDSISKKRINPSASVFIGDHVWIGQNALVLKGTRIGSGTIVGGAACAANKKIPSNVSVVGNPAKIVRSNVFFLCDSVQKWTADISQKYMQANTENYIYSFSSDTVDMDKIDIALKEEKQAYERLSKVERLFVNNTKKNRFFISPDGEKNAENTQ